MGYKNEKEEIKPLSGIGLVLGLRYNPIRTPIIILSNARIGEGSVTKAGTVVTRNVFPRTFWGTPQAEALGQVTVPLTAEHSHEEFMRGLRPIRRNQASDEQPHPKNGPELSDQGGRKISSL